MRRLTGAAITLIRWITGLVTGPTQPDTAPCDRPQRNRRKEWLVWWSDLLWGIWNGLTAWIILIAHVFGAWSEFPFYDVTKAGNWYNFGFLIGAGSPILGTFRR